MASSVRKLVTVLKTKGIWIKIVHISKNYCQLIHRHQYQPKKIQNCSGYVLDSSCTSGWIDISVGLNKNINEWSLLSHTDLRDKPCLSPGSYPNFMLHWLILQTHTCTMSNCVCRRWQTRRDGAAEVIVRGLFLLNIQWKSEAFLNLSLTWERQVK